MSLPAINPDLLTRRWPAAWCQHPDTGHQESAVYLFRRAFSLRAAPKSFVVHVSADQRYRLFVNGQPVVFGPARGDLMHWRFETVGIAPYLKRGRNVVGAVVHYMGEDLMPWAQMSAETGFLMQGDTEAESAVNTPGDWRVLRDDAYSFSNKDILALRSYTVIGPTEHFDARKHPWDWLSPDFDDSGWAKPTRKIRRGAAPRGMGDEESLWWLVPRPIPLMEETAQPFGRVVRVEGVSVPPDWPLKTGTPLTVPPKTMATVLFDHGVETCGFPQITVSGGKDATLRLAYAEALVDAQGRKGHRDRVEGRNLRGYGDTWTLDGGADRVLDTLWWRTFRYAELTIETGAKAVTISGLRSVYTGYPFQERAAFTAPEIEGLSDLWNIGWRTARLCAHETYMDCPYYEQLQYAGDTRIQCLVTLYMSGDHRLFRNALAQFNESRITDGLTQARYPCRMPQVISPFSLWWVGMVHDYWRHVPGDDDFLRGLLPGVRAVLGWYRDRMRPDGLLGPLQWWNFVDWCNEWPMGVPPGAKEGGSAIITLQYLLALREAADLEDALGRADEARLLRREAADIAGRVRRLCFVEEENRVADTPERATFSQHAAILSVLAEGVLPPVALRLVMERVMLDSQLTQATFYFRFYLNRAMVKAGLGDRYLEALEPWRQMRRIGLTTWAEKPEPTRSDCHAWSASPNYEFLATVLGVTPAAPGFSRVRVAPHLGTLTQAQGIIPHPKGQVTVNLRRDGKRLHAQVTLPDGIDGELAWDRYTARLSPGTNEVTLPRGNVSDAETPEKASKGITLW